MIDLKPTDYFTALDVLPYKGFNAVGLTMELK